MRDFRFLISFFVVSIIFWVSISGIGLIKLKNTSEEKLDMNLMEIDGEIADCEQYEGNDFYYFTLKKDKKRVFCISYIQAFSFEDLKKVEENEIVVTFQVKRDQYVENDDGSQIEVYSFYGGSRCEMPLNVYIEHSRQEYRIMIILGALLSVGMIFGLMYTWRLRHS